MSAQGVRGAQLPQSAGPAVYDVIDVRPGQPLDVTVLGESILGTACHWIGASEAPPRGRSRLCTEWQGECPYHDRRAIWQGFLAVYNMRERRRDVLRVGPVGARALLAHSVQHFGLRGVRLELASVGAGRTGTIEARKSDRPPLTPLLAAHCVEATVCLVLGCERLPDPLGPAGIYNPPAESDEKGGLS